MYWNRTSDLMPVKHNSIQEYDLSFREALGIWVDVHDLISEYSDLLEKAAEKLFKDKVLGAEYWEEDIRLSKKT